ncbi:MAG TPA: YggS family pyridoxal phosphate-dependent enzyme, partial [Candidatus Dojkabacteria bacterium]
GSLTQDEKESEKEFAFLAKIFKKYHKMHPENIKILSMGMSGDYKLGVENGANMIRVGSLVFG